MTLSTEPFTVNGRRYGPPARPVVVLCLDGSADAYLDAALDRGRMPCLRRMLSRGHRSLVRAALPSFTNVNNAAIVAGAPPAVTGISGNFFLDPESGDEVMMNDARFLRCETILAAAAKAGRRVAVVTAKDKLRAILSKGLEGIALSAENADELTIPGLPPLASLLGRGAPAIYTAEASLYVLDAGIALLEGGHADLLYLSTTDYVQHRFAPDEPGALDFYAGLDRRLGRLLDADALLAATADHGMNAKTRPDGGPNVLYLETLLKDRFGSGARVICPITDPYVVHHGALGSFVTLHLSPGLDASEVADFLFSLGGVTEVCLRDRAAGKLELPPDRIGDVVVLSGRDVVLGRSESDHDLSVLAGPLRSHGGRYEEMVPLLLSEPLAPRYARRAGADPRNFDVFDFAFHGSAASE